MTTKSQLVIRNVNKRIFQEFKSQVVREGIKIGDAIDIAMLMWIESERKRPRRILNLKPVRYKTKKASMDIDKELYGD